MQNQIDVAEEMDKFFKGFTKQQREAAESQAQFKLALANNDFVKCQEIANEFLIGNAQTPKEFRLKRHLQTYDNI